MYVLKFPKIANLQQSQHTDKKPVILIGVLDWGLGHASRMVPLIHYLLQTQCQILIAATGPQRKLLELEFPSLQFLSPPEYGVKYKKGKRKLVFGLIRQLPRLFQIITTEREWIRRISKLYDLDIIISDNRYGMRDNQIFSVIITHQLAPITGMGAVIDQIIGKLHASYLNYFNQIWVPDLEQKGLAGKLSHTGLVSKKLKYIGPVSRFEKTFNYTIKPGHLLVMLSGPEPNRSLFEELLLEQLLSYKGSYTLVRGLPMSTEALPNSINHADALTLQALIQEAQYIICRSGYTSVMDLLKLGKTALLVPTPGQTEQEYLANYLDKEGLFIHAPEKGFTLSSEVERLRNFRPQFPKINFSQFKSVLDKLIEEIKTKD